MKKKPGIIILGIIGSVIAICGAVAAISFWNEPAQAQQSCRGACGWQSRSCEHSCSSVEDTACMQRCQDEYRSCMSRCD